MVVDGEQASQLQSHVGWRKRLVEEKQWSHPAPPGIVEHVVGLEQTLLRRATEASPNNGFDLSFSEVQAELHAWDKSSVLPNDWIPRAALCCKLEVIEILIWCCLCRAWRLCLRPRPWGIAKQFVLHKKGELFLYTSWRNIIVNAQFGLLLEKSFFKRIVKDVRSAIGIFQIGYRYRC